MQQLRDLSERVVKCEFNQSLDCSGAPSGLSILEGANQLNLFEIIMASKLRYGAPNGLSRKDVISIGELVESVENLGTLPIYMSELSIRKVEKNTFPMKLGLCCEPAIRMPKNHPQVFSVPKGVVEEKLIHYFISPHWTFHNEKYIQGLAQCKTRNDLLKGFFEPKELGYGSEYTSKSQDDLEEITKTMQTHLVMQSEYAGVVAYMMQADVDPHSIKVATHEEMAKIPLIRIAKKNRHALVTNVIFQLQMMQQLMEKTRPRPKGETSEKTRWWPEWAPTPLIRESEEDIWVPIPLVRHVVDKVWNTISPINQENATSLKNVTFTFFNADKNEADMKPRNNAWNNIPHPIDTDDIHYRACLEFHIVFFVARDQLLKDEFMTDSCPEGEYIYYPSTGLPM